ncbi:MAG: putative zinc-binding metallopeptidase, partial [Myxococcota bacterium]|nr:putative zinc-binding metallopeptidase [Myxococcota bacterium]
SKAIPIAMSARRLDFHSFDEIIAAWFPLTTALNSLNRGMGLPDLYPFVLNTGAIRKLRFVHEIVSKASGGRSLDRPTAGADAQPETNRSPSPSSARGTASTVTRNA